MTGSPMPAGLRLSEEAVMIAEAHGWGTHRIAATAVAVGAAALVWLGRVDEAERWLDRVEGVQAPAEDFEVEPVLHYAHGFVRLGQRRFDEALAEFRAAERMRPSLAPEHALPVEVRGWIVQTQVSGRSDGGGACRDRRARRRGARRGRDTHRRRYARVGGRPPAGCRGGAGPDGRRRAAARGRRRSAGAQYATGDGPRAAAERCRARPARRSTHRRGIDRARARAR